MSLTGETNIGASILQYESFINDILKEDLKKILTQRDGIYSKIAEYLQLKRVIEQMQENESTTSKVMNDLGCNFYCQAEITDTSKVLIAVGFGFFVEFTLEEGLKFITKKVDILTKQAEKLTKDSASIKARIKLILTGLRDLQLLEFNGKQDQTNVVF